MCLNGEVIFNDVNCLVAEVRLLQQAVAGLRAELKHKKSTTISEGELLEILRPLCDEENQPHQWFDDPVGLLEVVMAEKAEAVENVGN